jgi:hypothetical protein
MTMMFGRGAFVTAAPVNGTDRRNDMDSAAWTVFIVLIQSFIFSRLWKAALPASIELT